MLTSLPPSECTRARESASSRLDGELSELEAVWLEDHLDDCLDCRAYAGELALVTSRLRATPLEQPRTAFVVPRRSRPLPRLRLVAVAAALLLAAGSSFTVGRMVRSQQAPPTAAHVPTTTGEILSLRADSTEQHILAMLPRAGSTDSLHAGRVFAL